MYNRRIWERTWIFYGENRVAMCPGIPINPHWTNMDLKDKVAIVTGAGQGIGLEICKQLVARGAGVVLNDIDATLAEGAVLEIDRTNVKCIAVSGDSSDMAVIQK